MINLSDYFIL